MKHMLILARGNAHGYIDLQGRSVLEDIPCRITLYTNEASAPCFTGLGSHVTVQRVRWSDLADITRRVEALHASAPLDAIGVLDEKMIDFAAELRERLGIPGMVPEQARRFRDKPTMKRLLGPAGVRVPEFAIASDRPAVRSLLRRHGKLVIKPNDGLGSREVVFIDEPGDLDAWYAACDDASRFEAEAFIDGVLYHVNALVRDGKPLLTAAAPYLPGMANIDFGSGAPFASVMLDDDDDLKQRLQAVSDRVIDVLGLERGVTHMECFVTSGSEIVFCEIAARPGGGGIIGMIEAQYGVNYARAALLLEAGLGERVQFDAPRPGLVAGLIGFRLPRSGFLRRIASPEAFGDDWIRSVTIDNAPGSFVAAAAHCTDFVGSFVFVAADRGDYEARRVELTRRFNDALELEAV